MSASLEKIASIDCDDLEGMHLANNTLYLARRNCHYSDCFAAEQAFQLPIIQFNGDYCPATFLPVEEGVVYIDDFDLFIFPFSLTSDLHGKSTLHYSMEFNFLKINKTCTLNRVKDEGVYPSFEASAFATGDIRVSEDCDVKFTEIVGNEAVCADGKYVYVLDREHVVSVLNPSFRRVGSYQLLGDSTFLGVSGEGVAFFVSDESCISAQNGRLKKVANYPEGGHFSSYADSSKFTVSCGELYGITQNDGIITRFANNGENFVHRVLGKDSKYYIASSGDMVCAISDAELIVRDKAQEVYRSDHNLQLGDWDKIVFDGTHLFHYGGPIGTRKNFSKYKL